MHRLVRWLDTPLAAAVVTAAAYATFVILLLGRHDWDVSRFVVAGGPLVDASRVPPGLTVIPGIAGYDGLAFYRLSLDPFTHHRTRFGIALDNPPYRHQRLGYPFLAWCLSAGSARAVPLALLAINFLSVVAIGFAAGAIARASGQHALVGLVASLYPGFVIVLTHDTSELLAAALAVISVALLPKRLGAAVGLFCYAVATRETTLLIVAGYWLAASASALRTRTLTARSTALTAPIATYIAIQAGMRWWWGSLPIAAGAPVWKPPFSEFIRLLVSVTPPAFHLERVYFFECLYFLVLIATGVAVVLRRNVDVGLRLAWPLCVLMTFSLPASVWSSDIGFMRAASELHVVTSLMVIQARSRMAFVVSMVVQSALWCVLAKHVYNFF